MFVTDVCLNVVQSGRLTARTKKIYFDALAGTVFHAHKLVLMITGYAIHNLTRREARRKLI